jgi:DNA gyrase subunit B
MIAFRKYLQIVERRGPPRDVVIAVLDRDARDKAFFGERARVEALAAELSGPQRTVTVQADEEHQAFALAIEDRSGGYPRHHVVDLDLVQTGEFRTLFGSYADVRGITGPIDVMTVEAAESDETETLDEPVASASDTAIGGARLDEATRLAAEPKREPAGRTSSATKSPVRIVTLDELVEFFIAAGKKGIAVNRYKGLGEMNPDTLWATTMNPETRTLLQVRAEDHAEADQMFTTLMGDQVEPRRKFIEDNALEVKNLDV